MFIIVQNSIIPDLTITENQNADQYYILVAEFFHQYTRTASGKIDYMLLSPLAGCIAEITTGEECESKAIYNVCTMQN